MLKIKYVLTYRKLQQSIVQKTAKNNISCQFEFYHNVEISQWSYLMKTVLF